MLSGLRGPYGRILAPIASILLRLGITPTQVTVGASFAVVGCALVLLPSGHFLLAAGCLMVALLGDGLDGTMARQSGQETRSGGFLDSTLDRLADAAIFAGLVLWGAQHHQLVLALALAALVLGFLVSYVRARAEAEGWEAAQGPFERTERLAVTWIAILAVGFGAPIGVLAVGLGIVAVGSAVTVVRRIRGALSFAEK